MNKKDRKFKTFMEAMINRENNPSEHAKRKLYDEICNHWDKERSLAEKILNDILTKFL